MRCANVVESFSPPFPEPSRYIRSPGGLAPIKNYSAGPSLSQTQYNKCNFSVNPGERRRPALQKPKCVAIELGLYTHFILGYTPTLIARRTPGEEI
jgi:hypothetical protein